VRDGRGECPARLAYRGLGEVVVFVFMGPVIVMGAYYARVEQWSWEAFVASLPIALLVAAILYANNARDIENDRRNGKWTLAALAGQASGQTISVRHFWGSGS
jgi:1,4-dihydroxy-2-naphthoate octaprenyltransferase